MPLNKTLTIITFAPDRTLGDVSAAYKLIEELAAANATDPGLQISINWIVRIYDLDTADQLQIFTHFLEGARRLGVNVNAVHSFDTRRHYLVPDAIKEVESSTDLFLAFPIYKDFYEAKEIIKCNKPLLVFNEYNPTNTGGCTLSHEIQRACIKTGLGRQKMGIFIPPDIPKWHEKAYSTDEHENSILRTLGIMGRRSATLDREHVDAYFAQHALYFSYFNRYLNYNDAINKKSFCILSAIIQAKKQHKDVDLIMRLDGLTLSALPTPETFACDIFSTSELELLEPYYSQIAIIDPSGNIRETRRLNADLTLPKIRIIDPFHVSTDGFKLLLSLAQPFAGTTGNESFAEAIANVNLMLYQIMGWKQILFEEFLTLCEKYTFPNSELVQFYTMQYARQLDIERFRNFVEEITSFIVANEAALLEQMAKVKIGILRDFNLAANLVPRLRHAIVNPAIIPELFNPYALAAQGIRVPDREYMLKHPDKYTQPLFASQFTSQELVTMREAAAAADAKSAASSGQTTEVEEDQPVKRYRSSGPGQ